MIDQYSKFSGLKPNYDKTLCIKIGSIINSDINFCLDYNLKWTSESFTFLGITFTPNLENMLNLNFDKKLFEIKKDISSWKRRIISPLGKITVVKSILLPKLTHLFISLPNPSDMKIKELEKMFYKYIWNEKPDRIARKTIVQEYGKGGLKMVCIKTFINSLKLTWIRRILNYNESA